ncbi:MAG: transcriptional regulator NrdR, partial [Peptococcaceae bacterium]|nr:transcriptional regulator NrdR [Peptococcaceae bacterium]
KAGLLKACEKRPIPVEMIDDAVYHIEKSLRNMNEQEIASTEIGEAVMERLFTLDEVAYIRFASVYRQFTDIQRFIEELNQLIEKKS